MGYENFLLLGLDMVQVGCACHFHLLVICLTCSVSCCILRTVDNDHNFHDRCETLALLAFSKVKIFNKLNADYPSQEKC